MIKEILESPLKLKKYRVIMSDGKKVDFGAKGSSTYLDHQDKIKRENYRKRHYVREKEFIDNLIISPATMSWYILWGDTTDLKTNIKHLNNLWKIKHK